MSKKKNPGLEFDLSIVGLLACPACNGDLRLDVASLDGLNLEPLNSEPASRDVLSELLCEACGRAYPIVDGIPVLITERAIESNP